MGEPSKLWTAATIPPLLELPQYYSFLPPRVGFFCRVSRPREGRGTEFPACVGPPPPCLCGNNSFHKLQHHLTPSREVTDVTYKVDPAIRRASSLCICHLLRAPWLPPTRTCTPYKIARQLLASATGPIPADNGSVLPSPGAIPAPRRHPRPFLVYIVVTRRAPLQHPANRDQRNPPPPKSPHGHGIQISSFCLVPLVPMARKQEP